MAGKKATVEVGGGWQERVVDEKLILDTKLEQLGLFVEGDAFKELSNYEQNLLVRQKEVMGDYSRVLEQRIATFQHVAE